MVRQADDQKEGSETDQIDGPKPAVESSDQHASSPLEVSAPGWRQTFKRTLKEIKDDRVTLIAAGMAFYLFLAIFPALIAAVGILGIIDESGNLIDKVTSSINANFPGESGSVLTEAVSSADESSKKSSFLAAALGIGAAIWSASSGMVAMQSGLNIAYDGLPERKFISKRLVAFGLLLAVGVLGGVPSPLFAFGDSLIFSILGWILTVVAVMVLFAIFYYLGPNREPPTWRWVSPGGLIGGTLWILVSLGFGFYVENFSTYGETYGPLAAVIVLIFWLYLSSIAILVGGEVNAELARQTSPGDDIPRR